MTGTGKSFNALWIRFADSGRRTHATNFEGVRGGGPSEVGVAVPESGYAGEGNVDASLREDKMPERIAIPSVPIIESGERTSTYMRKQTATEYGECHRLETRVVTWNKQVTRSKSSRHRYLRVRCQKVYRIIFKFDLRNVVQLYEVDKTIPIRLFTAEKRLWWDVTAC